VAGDDYGFIGQGQHGLVQRAHDLLHGAAGQVGAADGAGEQRVAGDQFLLRSEIQADAAFGVAGGVQDLGGVRSGSDGVSGRDAAINFDFAGRGHSAPERLDVEHFEQGVVVLVEQDGRAGGGAEFHGSADVVNVGVGDDDLFDLEIVLADEGEDVVDVVARINDHGFAGGLVADDGAVAVQRADGEDFVDHGCIVASSCKPLAADSHGFPRIKKQLRQNRHFDARKSVLIPGQEFLPRSGTRHLRGGGIGETILAVGRACGEISSAWLSGPRPGIEESRAARGRNAETAPGAHQRPAALGPRPWTEAGEFAGDTDGVAVRAVRDRARWNGDARDLSEMRVRTAFLQAVHVFRSGQPIGVHAAGERAGREEGRAE